MRDNRSYGLTTLRNHHVNVKGDRVRFAFRGKHGIRHEAEVKDPRVARVMRRCLELPGQDLFEYIDADGAAHDVGSSDVNRYVQEIAGVDFTAKDFRTWYATSTALEVLAGETFRTAREAKALLKAALEDVACRLRNTVTMCRKCYVNPVVIDAFLAGELRDVALSGARNERLRLLRVLTRTPRGVTLRRSGTAGAAFRRKRRSHHK